MRFRVPAFSDSAVDRRADRRADEAWLAEAWTRARVLRWDGSRVAVGDDGHLLLTDGSAAVGERAFLGEDAEGTPYFACLGRLPAGAVAGSLRDVGEHLDARDAGLVVHAVGLAEWHARHPRCAQCGAATEPALAGHIRRCPVCRVEHFPRTDPAVIMLVHDGGDRCLLGRQSAWPSRRFSTLAGFVEPGESLEGAVRREVGEEAGLAIGPVEYVTSQPWPFPSSLMVGFLAQATYAEPVLRDGELQEARWFTRAELRAAADAGAVLLSPTVSIARSLIDGWLDAPASEAATTVRT